MPALIGTRRALAGGRSADPAAMAYFARWPSPPDAGHRDAIDRLFKDWRAAGILSKIAVAHSLAAPSRQVMRLNAVGTYADLTEVNAPGWLADHSVGGDGSTSYLDAGVAFGALPLISIGDACQLVWSLTDAANDRVDAGEASAGGAHIYGRFVNDLLYVGPTGSHYASAAVTDSLGLFGWNQAATELQAIKNGTVVGTLVAAAPAAFGAGNVTLLAANGVYSPRRLAFHVIARRLIPSEHAALYDAVRRYLLALGVAGL